MTVTVKHSKTNAISDWTQAQLDEQIALGNFAEGTVLADIVLPSDWNNDHTLTGVGTMAEQDANSVAITGGSVNGTTIGATTASTGKFTSVTTPSVTATTADLAINSVGTGTITLSSGNGIAFRALDNGTTGNSWAAYGSTVSPVLEASGSATNVNGIVRTKGTGIIAFRTNTIDEQLRVSHTASAVNYVQVTGGATTAAPVMSVQGSDSNIFMQFNSKGTSGFNFYSGGGSFRQLRIDGANSSVNFLGIAGSVANQAPILNVASASSDTNVSLAIQPKGTGAINLAAGSSGVNISNGGTVTAITRTNSGSGYTTIPSIAITAPTTAGGVQATASVAQMQIAGATIAGGGTGYTVGNTLTIVGGTPVSGAATLTVTTVSAGVITGVSIAAFNNYTALPTNPVSVTGGSGSGATFNLTWAVISFTITNAGSGYIEQPTITFSGGGGSGASAYATVGSGTILRTIGNTLSFTTPAGEAVRVIDNGATTVNYWQMQGRQASGGVLLSAQGTDANITSFISSKGTGNLTLTTNNFAQIQFNVTHTASAVNYVQVTGAATTGSPIVSAQGSDTNISLGLQPKGNGVVNSNSAMNIGRGSTNWVQGTGSSTGVAVGFTAFGGDTNIDLALTPKGTGLVRFGTYVAGALTATGYINIKAADGTTYKVLVST